MSGKHDQDSLDKLCGDSGFSRRALVKGALVAAAAAPVALSARPGRAGVDRQHRGGTLRIGTEIEFGRGTEVLDPASPRRYFPTLLALYNRLVRPNAQLSPSPDLALSWHPNSTADVWTFRLRPGVKFHNGKRLTSKDVAYTFRRILDPALGSPSASVLTPLLDTVTAPNALTAVFKLKQPDADFPTLLMHYGTNIIPDGSGDTIGKTGIGTGPFKVQQFAPGGQTVLVSNLSYWKGRPALDTIIYIGIADAQARTSALLADQVDLLYSGASLDFGAAKQIAGNSKYIVQDVPSGDWADIVMGTDRPPFDDVRVRQALKLVVAPGQMIQAATQGHAAPAGDSPVWNRDPYRLKFKRVQNIDKAKALLADAGHRNGVELTLHTSSASGIMIPIAVTFKEMAKKAGVRVDIQEDPADSYFSKVWLKSDFLTSTWNQRPADQVLNEVFRSSAAWNETYWKNKKFDQLLDLARRQTNFAKRRRLYRAAQQLIVNESGAIIPLFQNRLRAMNKRVTNFSPTQQDPDFFTLSVR